MPTHTSGTRTDTTPVVQHVTGITSGTAVITMTSFPDGKTLDPGRCVHDRRCLRCRSPDKQRYSHLQQWVVTAGETGDGFRQPSSPAVSPTPITSGAKQNMVVARRRQGRCEPVLLAAQARRVRC